MGTKNSLNEPQKIKTEDGYTFYRLKDGRYADSQDEDSGLIGSQGTGTDA